MKHLIILLIILNGVFFEASSQNIPSMRLKDVDFQPSTFTPSTYKPIDNSSSFLKLQETLFKQEQYEYAVGEKYVNFCKLLGYIYRMLYSDKDLLTWYNKYKENAISDIESNYEAGNYQSTSRLIDERIAEMTSDAFVLGRSDASEK